MELFQILILVLTGLGLLSGIVAVYVKCNIDIAKIQVELAGFRRELNLIEITRLHTEAINREDHKEIITKIDKLISKENIKI